MNIILWIVQIVVALYCAAGSAFRFFAYETAAKGVPSIQAIPHGVWNAIGVFEILCALGLILPPLFKAHRLTFYAAVGLTVEMLLVSALHLKFFGLAVNAANPAMWTLGLAVASAFVAYGRREWRTV